MPKRKKPTAKVRASRGRKEVSAMGWIEDPHGAVLLVKQKRGQKLWTLPGGKVLATETVENGLLREISEETGAKVIFSAQIAMFDRPEKRNLTFLYRAKLSNDTLKAQPREIAAIEYRTVLPADSSPSLQYFWKLLRSGVDR